MLTIDQSQIARFVGSLFRYADDGTYASLRAFDQKRRDVPPVLIESVKINGSGLAELTRRAGIAAQKAANAESPAVFAPPIATFTDDFRARRTDLANGLTLSVEIDDTDPEQAKATLESILGPATVVVQSGSDWTDPVTGEIKPNVHLHWRLSEPTRTDEEHDRLHDARRIAMRMVGADPTGTPAVHPLRWPGSYNVKRAPRLAIISTEAPDAEIHLVEALERLQEAEEKAGFASIGTPASAKPEIDKRRLPLLISAIRAIPNPGVAVHYDDWIRTGYALWRACGGSEQGRALWEDWSKKSDKFNAAEQDAAWLRIAAACSGRNPPRTAGAGTIFHRAALVGWQMPGRDNDEPTPANNERDGAETPAQTAAQTAQAPHKTPVSYPLPVTFFNEISASIDCADFIEGVLISADMSVVYGPSNSGKSFWTLDLALHVAAGKEWNGREVDRCGVLWLAMEGAHGISNRVTAWREYHCIGEAEIPFAVIPIALNLLDPHAHTGPLIDTINAIKDRLNMKVGWTIVDTLSRAIAGGNENGPDDMGALVTNGTRIQQETKTHLTWIHHSGKDEARGARGHSLLRAATGTEIEISAEGSHIARVTKQRELENTGEFPFNLKVVELGTNRRGKPVTSCVVEVPEGPIQPQARTVRLKGHARRAMDALNDVLGSSGATGFPGVPPGIPSVPEKWWRDRFYDRTADDGKGDVSQNGKRMAYNRALLELQDLHLIGVAKDRIWIVGPAQTPAQTPAHFSQ
jgi:hypothetical protein